MSDDLEVMIAGLVNRLNRCVEGSAEYRMVERQLRGLRYSCERAGDIIDGHGCLFTARPLDPVQDPQGQIRPLVRRSVSRRE